MIPFRKFTIGALACLAIVSGCGSDNDNNNTGSNFDRQGMVTNYADNIIIPGYADLKTEVSEMAAAVDAFTAAPSEATLAAVREAFQETYLQWQEVSMYEFGPADEQMLRTSLNIYPTTVSQIESNIATGTYDLNASANVPAQGLPAIDYLLYSDANVLAKFTTDANATNRKKYLQDVTNLAKQRIEATYNAWTGNYKTTFIQAQGTAVGSAIGYLVNALNEEIDLTKRAKVGIPAGKFVAGNPFPEKVEAYYSQKSLTLLVHNLQAMKAMFMGVGADGTNGLGLDDYLDRIGAKKGDLLLSDAIEQQFNLAISAAQAIPGPLSDAVVNNQAAVNKVYDELQKLIVLTKTDMPSKLGVTITYNDNDGD